MRLLLLFSSLRPKLERADMPWVWHSDISWFQDGWHSFTTGAEKKGKSTRRQSSQPAHSCTVAACTLPGTVPGARDAAVSGAKPLPSRDPHSPGREISKEAITFHSDEGMRRATGHQAQ